MDGTISTCSPNLEKEREREMTVWRKRERGRKGGSEGGRDEEREGEGERGREGGIDRDY